ncbi:phytoene desaturase family protein [Leucobacter denitrificans]|uniref:NAD(P)/FAD-dependent oxidoreductase n=1 Tax=Leucobacter denitrificans TaxID=683042 RepID=A0A7G9S5Z2_9MICO|nr:NAD(P)/FAD-dependent oxidoreductase [Leucobacter denitrificans]QNN63267.1 NAD(P)/FAD-dependent oxidoreductase [Leucobacter denitrificans]
MKCCRSVDAVVVGAGPNGLAAALTLAQRGLEVQLFERAGEVGGACRTETWGDGYRSDWGAAVHPMALASPFFNSIQLAERLKFFMPEISIAHPLENRAALAWRSLDKTSHGLGADGVAWRTLVGGLARNSESVVSSVLDTPLRLPFQPKAAMQLAKSSLLTRCGAGLRTEAGRALLAGIVAHSVGVQPRLGVSAAGVVLASLAHSVGWPIPASGSGAITQLLAQDFLQAGGVIHLNEHITKLSDLPHAKAYLFDTSASDMVSIAGDRVTTRYANAAARVTPGDAVSKVDLVLEQPIPWKDEQVGRAGTVHVCGTQRDVRLAEYEVSKGRHAENPMIVLSQPSAFDASRAPSGKHVVWAYAHVPAGSNLPQTETILRSLERFAPGTQDLVAATRSTTAREIGTRNPAMPGGDFASGALTLRQVVGRPVLSANPWQAGNGIYLCSGAAAPGPGVHGMAGHRAAVSAIKKVFH